MIFDKYVFRPGCCEHTATDKDVVITGPCYYCKSPQTVQVAISDLARFRDGVYAQNCFSYLSPADREFLISGICGKCWDDMFSTEDVNHGDDATTPE